MVHLTRTMFRCVVLFTAVIASVVTLQPSRTVAAIEINWSAPFYGVTRTDLHATSIDLDPTSGYVYATLSRATTTTLAVIDPDALAIVAETVLETNALYRTTDIDVSSDGARVVVVTGRKLHDLRTGDLGGHVVADLPFSAEWHVVAAPGNASRSVVWSVPGTVLPIALLANGVALTALSAETVLPFPAFVFGDDPNTLYNRSNSRIRTFDVSGDPVETANVYAPALGGLFEYRAGVLWNDRYLLDLITLDYTPIIPAPSPFVSPDLVLSPKKDRLLVIETNDIMEFDAATRTPRRGPWVMPIQEHEIAAYLSLANDHLAVIEGAPSGASGLLSFVDPEILMSPIGDFHAVTPYRLLDTRNGTGTAGVTSPLGPGASITVGTAAGEVPNSGVMAVAVNVTVTAPTAPSFFTLWAHGGARPTVSNLNFNPGQTLANFATVPVGPSGRIELYNGHGTAHAVIDVVGYYVDQTGQRGARFDGVSEYRLVDTRSENGPRRRPLGPQESLTMTLKSQLWASVVVLNVTAIDPTAPTFLTVWPIGADRPVASSLNVVPGEVRANLVVTAVRDGQFSIYNEAGTVDVVIDVVGVYTVPTEFHQSGRFYPVEPYRRFDSRVASPFPNAGSLTPGSVLILRGSPGSVEVTNVTAVSPSRNGFLSVVRWDQFADQSFRAPETSNINFRAGQIVSNATYAPAAPDYAVYNPYGSTHVVVDVFGYFR